MMQILLEKPELGCGLHYGLRRSHPHRRRRDRGSYKPLKILAFGSYAYGYAYGVPHADSDGDFLFRQPGD